MSTAVAVHELPAAGSCGGVTQAGRTCASAAAVWCLPSSVQGTPHTLHGPLHPQRHLVQAVVPVPAPVWQPLQHWALLVLGCAGLVLEAQLLPVQLQDPGRPQRPLQRPLC